MSKLNKKQVQDRGREVIAQAKTGVKWSELIKRIASESPETPLNSVSGWLYSLVSDEKEGIVKKSRGVYVSAGHENAGEDALKPDSLETKEIKVETVSGTITTVAEEAFYTPFAEWLKGEIEEATVAVKLGGNILKGKWGTPDVLGVLKPLKADPYSFRT